MRSRYPRAAATIRPRRQATEKETKAFQKIKLGPTPNKPTPWVEEGGAQDDVTSLERADEPGPVEPRGLGDEELGRKLLLVAHLQAGGPCRGTR